MKNRIPQMFGSLVFGESAMREYLPKETYKAVMQSITQGKSLSIEVANVVANAMKDWATEHGATHYTHWFQPLTGVTAEKHDSFLNPDGKGGCIMEFSGKELVKGETDASSFPSGGLRATFEARGYTAWDPTSYAFIKDGSLCIPTAFCSYTGDALDKKTPLLRSMEALNKQAMRILKLFDPTSDVKQVITTVGAEQEYFLVDKAMFLKRPDLIYTGRTLFGAKPPLGQDMDAHYFGSIKPRVSAFMKELDEELWKLGIASKTKHNEAAPAQHEMAPVFETTNIATDHNQLVMEIMRKVADRHDLVCLLHEKPFAGVNGSGKHNNWSMSTDTGVNLLEPGKTPWSNAQFLLFLVAVIKAVNEHQDMLRVTVASAGNDHRLGACEAPPAIVSIFLGDELTAILDTLLKRETYEARARVDLEIGASVLPHFAKDTTDRNRTSPFAFTGNKFEFRSVGSSFSIADPNTVLNTIVADVLRQFADRLQNAEDFQKELGHIIRKTYRENKQIVFNGNNYSEEWVEEAKNRGLLNLSTTPDALPYLVHEKNIKLFSAHGVFSQTEMYSRREIMEETYSKVLHIEALTMIDMTRKYIIPSVLSYEEKLLDIVTKKQALGVNADLERRMLERISRRTVLLSGALANLEDETAAAKQIKSSSEKTLYYKEKVVSGMEQLRKVSDELEVLVSKECWQLPTYGDLLYSVN